MYHDYNVGLLNIYSLLNKALKLKFFKNCN